MVKVSKDYQNFSNPVFGWVFNAKHGSADILTFVPGRGPTFIQAALHRHDPKIKTNPDWFDPAKGYENSGVFELAETELVIRQIEKDYGDLRSTLMGIQELLHSLTARVEALEATNHPPAQAAESARRGPGRPRKQLQEVA
jgi:hypothetical protein